MAKEKGPAKVFAWKDIDTIYKAESERGDGGTILRVGCWTVDGKATRAVVEKRDYWNEEGGGMKVGKAKGLNGSDLLKVLERKNIIFPALGVPAKEVELAWGYDDTPKTFGEHQEKLNDVPAGVAPGEPF
jgi:hypothetical protein